MRYLVFTLLLLAIGLIGVAFADDMDDNDAVVRQEHVTPPADKQDKQAKQDKQETRQAPDEAPQPAHDHSAAPAEMGDGNRMGAYFGLGDDFKDTGSAGWSDGSPLLNSGSNLHATHSANPPDKAEVEAAAKHTAQDQTDEVGFDQANHNILRRGADHDYFWD